MFDNFAKLLNFLKSFFKGGSLPFGVMCTFDALANTPMDGQRERNAKREGGRGKDRIVFLTKEEAKNKMGKERGCPSSSFI